MTLITIDMSYNLLELSKITTLSALNDIAIYNSNFYGCGASTNFFDFSIG
jgi:hypothetical protein